MFHNSSSNPPAEIVPCVSGGNDDVLVRVEGVSKKFCRSLKRSLWYGVKDVARALNPFGGQRTGGREQGAENRSQEEEISGASDSPRTSDFRPPTSEPPLRSGEFWAVKDVSFELRRGECLGLIGHNGAGKSTLLKILNGLNPPDAGRITMKGRVCALIELNAGFNPILSGRENIFNQAALLGFTKEETLTKFDDIVEFAETGDFLDMPVQNYSSGMRVRLGFAIAVQMEPDVLIIDEVLAVGDLGFRFKCLNRISEMLDKAAVIFVSHSMPQVMRIATDIMVLKGGREAFSGKNLGAGLDAYFSQFSETGMQINGTSEIKITDLKITSSLGECGVGGRLSARHEEDLEIEISLEANSDIDTAVVQALFWNHEMIPVLDIADRNRHGFLTTFDSESSTAIIHLTVRNLPLNAGKYHLSIIVTEPNLERVYCQMDHAVALTVASGSPASGAGCVSLGDWKLVI